MSVRIVEKTQEFQVVVTNTIEIPSSAKQEEGTQSLKDDNIDSLPSSTQVYTSVDTMLKDSTLIEEVTPTTKPSPETVRRTNSSPSRVFKQIQEQRKKAASEPTSVSVGGRERFPSIERDADSNTASNSKFKKITSSGNAFLSNVSQWLHRVNHPNEGTSGQKNDRHGSLKSHHKGVFKSAPNLNFNSSSIDETQSLKTPSKLVLELFGFVQNVMQFNCENAATTLKELVQKSPESTEKWIEMLSDFVKMLPDVKIENWIEKDIENRTYEVLAHLAFDANSAPFIIGFCRRNISAVPGFALVVYDKLQNSADLFKCIQMFTEMEAPLEKLQVKEDSRYRQNLISEELTVLYSKTVLKLEMEDLINVIQTYLDQQDRIQLCINRSALLEYCKNRIEFMQLSQEAQDAKIADTQEGHCKKFAQFLDYLFEQIYSITLPPEAIALLSMRREIFEKHFSNSLELIGQLFFLKFLNPLLTQHPDFKKDPLTQRLMIDFSKVLQNIANGLLFGDGKNISSSIPYSGKSDPIFEKFNDVIVKFIPRHREFLEKNTKI